jgi:hypothetical protein
MRESEMAQPISKRHVSWQLHQIDFKNIRNDHSWETRKLPVIFMLLWRYFSVNMFKEMKFFAFYYQNQRFNIDLDIFYDHENAMCKCIKIQNRILVLIFFYKSGLSHFIKKCDSVNTSDHGKFWLIFSG